MSGARAEIPRRRRNSSSSSSWFSIGLGNSGNRRHGEERGARVMWLMLLIGMALAAGFIFALRSQFNAYRIAQAEEQLKMKLDEYARQQKFLTVDKQRALSASESDQSGRYGLDHLKLDRESAQRNASSRKFITVPPVKIAQDGDQNDRLAAGGRNNPRPEDHPERTASQAKAAKVAKSVKSAKVVNVVKSKAANKSKNDNRKRQ